MQSHVRVQSCCHAASPSGRCRCVVERHVSGWVYGAQELHELVTDLGRGFVLYPVAHMVEFETSHETRKTDSKLIYSQRVELFEPIRLPHHVEGRLSDLRASKSGG